MNEITNSGKAGKRSVNVIEALIQATRDYMEAPIEEIEEALEYCEMAKERRGRFRDVKFERVSQSDPMQVIGTAMEIGMDYLRKGQSSYFTYFDLVVDKVGIDEQVWIEMVWAVLWAAKNFPFPEKEKLAKIVYSVRLNYEHTAEYLSVIKEMINVTEGREYTEKYDWAIDAAYECIKSYHEENDGGIPLGNYAMQTLYREDELMLHLTVYHPGKYDFGDYDYEDEYYEPEDIYAEMGWSPDDKDDDEKTMPEKMMEHWVAAYPGLIMHMIDQGEDILALAEEKYEEAKVNYEAYVKSMDESAREKWSDDPERLSVELARNRAIAKEEMNDEILHLPD